MARRLSAPRAGVKVCGVCHAPYRGTYAVHMTTQRHRLNAHRASGDTRGIVERVSKRARRDAAWKKAGRTEHGYLSRIMVRVKKHRRRRPSDGPAKVVRVINYHRHKPQVFHELRTHKGHLFHVTRAISSGAMLSTRYASKADRARWAAAPEHDRRAGKLML